MRPTFYNCLENESNPIYNFLFPQKPSLISKDEKENIICTMDDVRGNFLGTPAHGTTLDAVIVNKNFKRSADINENENGPYRKTTGTRSKIFNEIVLKDNHLLNNVT